MKSSSHNFVGKETEAQREYISWKSPVLLSKSWVHFTLHFGALDILHSGLMLVKNVDKTQLILIAACCLYPQAVCLCFYFRSSKNRILCSDPTYVLSCLWVSRPLRAPLYTTYCFPHDRPLPPTETMMYKVETGR